MRCSLPGRWGSYPGPDHHGRGRRLAGTGPWSPRGTPILGSTAPTLTGAIRGTLTDMEERREFGMFLQSRRALVSPGAAGIDGNSRRRVRGLRREELAQLAGVSVDYYIRLEQGRVARPSVEVLDAIGRVLCLDAEDHARMHPLARPPRPPER